MDKKVTLDTTASLVMQWAMPIFNDSEIIKNFLTHFDLSNGDELRKLCEEHTNLGSEVLQSRKFWVYQTITKILEQSVCPYQVVLLAAGKSPISLQLLLNHSDKIANIFEVDLEDLSEKVNIYEKVSSIDLSKLKAFTYNITDANLHSELKKYGYQDNIPTVIILEGITYYILPEHLKAITNSFSNKGDNTLIFDFTYPFRVNTSLAKQVTKVFEIIKEYCSLPFLSSYSAKDLESLLEENIESLDYLYIKDIENLRKGKNIVFNTEDKELIGFATAKLKK